MSFYPVMTEYASVPLTEKFAAVTEDDVRRSLNKMTADVDDFINFMSPAAVPLLEEMAQKANRLTEQNFGKAIQLFTPLYLSNFCTNHCVYCGFNCKNKIPREQLTMEELDVEGKAIAATGLKHLLILTGEAPAKAGVDFLEDSLNVLRKYFPSVSIEVFAMDEDEYVRMVAAGADGLTMFQETYNEELYATLHPKGPKKDYRYRLDAPERGCLAGMRVVTIGALLGLGDWHRDAFFTGLHAAYLMHKYPEVDISVSPPRMRPHAGEYEPVSIAEDKDLVQYMLALRLFLPRLGITVSTRESPEFREKILPLGVTKISAGVSTAVGGHTQENEHVGQFEIADSRSVPEVCEMLNRCGYQPVYKDWEPIKLDTKVHA
ncbi:2-iminoacetate synthase ThiH [Pseudodesulfovibrio sp. JC047]|uniref:2-iminoacetate synthase ThiH n=1 Tax=Pseudodesulfovibrio sp. JC047 TaxID=2683199 RepID=UPI0013D31C9A|nr:2-iminoacetate synthase ThiH [Pseudodesulfovibrio sp. JC047]NDV18954.1 2-iminoacetate synthase ThiH [Pseudodesulfovibrio sp. JC047]